MKTVNVFNFTGTYILNNLKPSTQYNIYVRAVRLIGVNEEILEGNSSVMATAKTLGKETMYTVHNNIIIIHAHIHMFTYVLSMV